MIINGNDPIIFISVIGSLMGSPHKSRRSVYIEISTKLKSSINFFKIAFMLRNIVKKMMLYNKFLWNNEIYGIPGYAHICYLGLYENHPSEISIYRVSEKPEMLLINAEHNANRWRTSFMLYEKQNMLEIIQPSGRRHLFYDVKCECLTKALYDVSKMLLKQLKARDIDVGDVIYKHPFLA